MKARLRLIRATLMLTMVTSGCAVHRTSVYDGREFPLERIQQISARMDADAVRKRLGSPYATGVDADGRRYWEYRYRGQQSTSAGGGLLLAGFVASQASVGGEVRVVFDATDRVGQVIWEIAGADAYRVLGGGGGE
ncbi:MAG: hypothetical protein H7125_03265 [Proteobacteria bacterium]|nr:hypothetical protein [Burkholderiales bacterium]